MLCVSLTNFRQIRATQIVVDHEARREQPPSAMNLSRLSAQHQKPTLSELSALWNLSRIVALMCNQACAWLPHGAFDVDERLEQHGHLPQCRDRIVKSMYRGLIAAAALSGVYNEPIYKAESAITPENFSTEDAKRLGHFPAYQTTCRAEDEHAMFYGFAIWYQDTVLTENSRTIMTERFRERRGRGLCCAGRVDGAKAGEEDDDATASDDGGEGPDEDEGSDEDEESEEDEDEACPLQDIDSLSHSDVHLLIWETMQLLWAVEIIRVCCSFGANELGKQAKENSSKTLYVVPFGAFRPVPMHLWKEDGPSPAYDYAPAPAPEGVSVSDFRKTYVKVGTPSGWGDILDWMHGSSGQPNHYRRTDNPIAPLHLKLFEFLVRLFANARFSLSFFQSDWEEHWVDLMTLTDSCVLFTSDEQEGRGPCRQDLLSGGFTDGALCLETRRGKGKPAVYYS